MKAKRLRAAGTCAAISIVGACNTIEPSTADPDALPIDASPEASDAAAVGAPNAATDAADAGEPNAASDAADVGPPNAGSDAAADAAIEPPDAGSDAAVEAGPTGVTVEGRAWFRSLDSPIGGAIVKLGAVQVTTGDDGKLTFTNVEAPYDLSVASTTKGIAIHDVFRGLTSTSPTLESALVRLDPARSTKITGALAGLPPTVPQGMFVRVFTRTNYGAIAVQTLSAGQAAAYSLSPSWYGPVSRTFTVRAFAYTSSSVGALPTAWNGYGSTTVNVTDGQVTSNADVTLTQPATRTLTGTISPAGYTGTIEAMLRFGSYVEDGAAHAWETPVASPFSLVVPDVPGATNEVWIRRLSPSGAIAIDALADQQSYAMIDPPGEPTPIAPADGATFTPGMTFTWSGPASGVYRFILAGASVNANTFSETTTATSVTLPPGFAPTAGAPYTWQVRSYPRAASVDDLVGIDATRSSPYVGAARSLVVP